MTMTTVRTKTLTRTASIIVGALFFLASHGGDSYGSDTRRNSILVLAAAAAGAETEEDEVKPKNNGGKKVVVPILHEGKVRFEIKGDGGTMKELFGVEKPSSEEDYSKEGGVGEGGGGTIEITRPIHIIASPQEHGIQWSEGPLYIQPHHLLFSDTESDRLYIWDKSTNETRILLEPGGGLHDDPELRKSRGEPGPNGLALHPLEKYVVVMQHGHRRVVKLSPNPPKHDGKKNDDTPPLIQTSLADKFQNERFHSPNDGVYTTKGSLIFTDPPYGLRPMGSSVEVNNQHWLNDLPDREMTRKAGVYTLPHSEEEGIRLLMERDLPRANGVALSPDETILYVSNSGFVDPALSQNRTQMGEVGRGTVTAYDITYDSKGIPKSLIRPRPVVNFAGTHHKISGKGTRPGTVDGITVDNQGRLYTSGPGGVYIFDVKVGSAPPGSETMSTSSIIPKRRSTGSARTIMVKHAGTILTDTKVANLSIGTDGGLYVCAHEHVFRIPIHAQPANGVDDASASFPDLLLGSDKEGGGIGTKTTPGATGEEL